MVIDIHRAIKYRKLSVVGVGICVVSSIVMTIRWIDGIKGIEIFYGFPWAVGGGILLSAQFLALTIWSSDRIANSTAIYFLSQQMGQIVGTSGSAAALQKIFSNRLGVNFGDISSPVKNKVMLCFLIPLIMSNQHVASIDHPKDSRRF